MSEAGAGICDACDQGLTLPAKFHGLDCPKRGKTARPVAPSPVDAARARMLQAIEEYTQAVTLEAGREAVRAGAIKAGRESWKPGAKNLEQRREIARKNGSRGGRPRGAKSATSTAAIAPGDRPEAREFARLVPSARNVEFHPGAIAGRDNHDSRPRPAAKRERLVVWKK